MEETPSTCCFDHRRGRLPHLFSFGGPVVSLVTLSFPTSCFLFFPCLFFSLFGLCTFLFFLLLQNPRLHRLFTFLDRVLSTSGVHLGTILFPGAFSCGMEGPTLHAVDVGLRVLENFDSFGQSVPPAEGLGRLVRQAWGTTIRKDTAKLGHCRVTSRTFCTHPSLVVDSVPSRVFCVAAGLSWQALVSPRTKSMSIFSFACISYCFPACFSLFFTTSNSLPRLINLTFLRRCWIRIWFGKCSKSKGNRLGP